VRPLAINKALYLFMKTTIALVAAFTFTTNLFSADVKPLKVLLITGGCCHDYAKQKDILKKGIEERINAEVTQIHTDDKSTKPPLAILGNADYAKGFDVVIHDECAADIKDVELVKAVLKPHMDGIPGVNLHCAMHSYRVGNPGKPHAPTTPEAMWFDYLGLQSSSHGPQEPITISYTAKNHPISKSLENWTTMKEELYNNIQITTGKELAKGAQVVKKKKKQADGTETVEESTVEAVVAWTNLYNNKTRVFSTTIGHNNATIEDPRYLDLVTRGLLWAAGRLSEDGKVADGYAKAMK
jgi:hypothetical protein